jgi:hypothetical protein
MRPRSGVALVLITMTSVLGMASSSSPAWAAPRVPTILPDVRASTGRNAVVEAAMATDPTSEQRLLSGAIDHNCPSQLGFYVSKNAGATWKRTCMTLVAGQTAATQPQAAFGPDGTAYIAGVQTGAAPSEIVLQTSTNGGMTWTPPSVVATPSFPGGSLDHPVVAVDRSAVSPREGSIYFGVTELKASGSRSRVSLVASGDGGTTWTKSRIERLASAAVADEAGGITVGADGTVYAAWLQCTLSAGTCAGQPATDLFSASADGGTTWSAPVTVAAVTNAPDDGCGAFYGCLPNTQEPVDVFPALGVDISSVPFTKGRLYVIATTWNGVSLRVLSYFSKTAGATWTGPVPLASSAKHDQFFPTVANSTFGNVGVVWLDRRNDAADVSYEPMVGLSTDGVGYSQSIQISTSLSNPSLDGSGGTFMGQYIGAAWAAKTLHVAWMDTRTGISQDETGGLALPPATSQRR